MDGHGSVATHRDLHLNLPSDLSIMLIALSILAVIYLSGLLVLAGAVWRAPEGFEDEQGFHEGRHVADDTAL